MKAYRTSANLKGGLIVAAVVIAVASVWYTNGVVRDLQEREQRAIELWANALAYLAQTGPENPHLSEFERLSTLVADPSAPLPSATRDSLQQALSWARSMPASDEVTFVTDNIIFANLGEVPAILTDAAQTAVLSWRNVPEDPDASAQTRTADLLRRAADMDTERPPLRLDLPGGTQLVHYADSKLVQQLRWFPYVQLVFVGLFILVGYLGFSYVRRSEQSNLWVGMAKEAAHQLGTPLSSMMGWLALMEAQDGQTAQDREIADELQNDVLRLQRVANRFSNIGSAPKLKPQPLAPVVEGMADYMRRRIPQRRAAVTLTTEVPPGITVPLNVELFEWVIENLLKNALDALEGDGGAIHVRAAQAGGEVTLDVADTGKGIEKRDWKTVFRPGYSTKKRGWGLGLSLTRRIVEDYHRGRIAVHASRPGEGTTFRITLRASAA